MREQEEHLAISKNDDIIVCKPVWIYDADAGEDYEDLEDSDDQTPVNIHQSPKKKILNVKKRMKMQRYLATTWRITSPI